MLDLATAYLDIRLATMMWISSLLERTLKESTVVLNIKYVSFYIFLIENRLFLEISKFICIWYQVVRGVVESLKIITRQASLRVAEYAFHYAKTHGRERVSAIHKANIMQKTDGLFLKVHPFFWCLIIVICFINHHYGVDSLSSCPVLPRGRGEVPWDKVWGSCHWQLLYDGMIKDQPLHCDSSLIHVHLNEQPWISSMKCFNSIGPSLILKFHKYYLEFCGELTYFLFMRTACEKSSTFWCSGDA